MVDGTKKECVILVVVLMVFEGRGGGQAHSSAGVQTWPVSVGSNPGDGAQSEMRPGSALVTHTLMDEIFPNPKFWPNCINVCAYQKWFFFS